MNIQTSIDQRIVDNYPTFSRGIVVAQELNNRGSSSRLEIILHEVIAQAKQNPVDFYADNRISEWDKAHLQFQSNPNKFPPAHRNLLKRVQKSNSNVPFINKVVAIMNINSIRDVLPVGGDDVDKAGTELQLCYASGKETFTPLGVPETVEHPEKGEVIYLVKDSGKVMCRRWNWRNSHATRISEDTKTIVMNVDAIGEGSRQRAIETRDFIAQMLVEFCQAEVQTSLLCAENPVYDFEI